MNQMNDRTFLLRLFSMFLALLMLLCCVTGCKKGKVDDETKTSPSGELDTDEPSGELKPVFSGNTYDDTTFTVLLRENGSGADKHYDELAIDKLSAGSSEVDKAVYQRNKDVEDQFHITLTFLSEKDNLKIVSYVRTASLADPDTYDLIVAHGRNIFELATDGYFMDWNDLPYVNVEAPWWNQSAAENWSTPGGKLFALTGDISYLSVGVASATYFNRDAFTNSGLTSPYEYVKAGTWTLANFMASAKETESVLTGGDGSRVLGIDTFGYVTTQWRGPGYVQYCAGDMPLVLNKDSNQYEIGFSERTQTAVDGYLKFLNDRIGAYYHAGSVGVARKAFTDHQVVYYDDNIWSALLLKDVNFGIVPWPKYEEQDSYIALGGSGSNTFAVMANTSVSNRERISDILEAMAYYGYRDVVPYYFDTVLSYQSVKDPDAREMLQLIRDSLLFELSDYLNPGGDLGALARAALRDNTSFSTKVTAIKDSAMLDLELWYALDK